VIKMKEEPESTAEEFREGVEELEELESELEEEVGKETVQGFMEDVNERLEPGDYFNARSRRGNPFSSNGDKLEKYRESGLLSEQEVEEVSVYTFTERGLYAAENRESILEELHEVDELSDIDAEVAEAMAGTDEVKNPGPGYDSGFIDVGDGQRVQERKISKQGKKKAKLTRKGVRDRNRAVEFSGTHLHEVLKKNPKYEPGAIERLRAVKTASPWADEEIVASRVVDLLGRQVERTRRSDTEELDERLFHLREGFQLYREMLKDGDLREASQPDFRRDLDYMLNGIDLKYSTASDELELPQSSEVDQTPRSEILEMTLGEYEEILAEIEDYHDQVYQR
jgi:hypothetical protein